jgi:hypothetical protein
MIIIGADYHPRFQQIALADADAGEFFRTSIPGSDSGAEYSVTKNAGSITASRIDCCVHRSRGNLFRVLGLFADRSVRATQTCLVG